MNQNKNGLAEVTDTGIPSPCAPTLLTEEADAADPRDPRAFLGHSAWGAVSTGKHFSLAQSASV